MLYQGTMQLIGDAVLSDNELEQSGGENPEPFSFADINLEEHLPAPVKCHFRSLLYVRRFETIMGSVSNVKYMNIGSLPTPLTLQCL